MRDASSAVASAAAVGLSGWDDRGRREPDGVAIAALAAVRRLTLLGGVLAMRIRVLQAGDASARQPHRSLRFA